jgi:hypothetical protein
MRALVRMTSDENKVETLRSAGAELCIGNLKEPELLASSMSRCECDYFYGIRDLVARCKDNRT